MNTTKIIFGLLAIGVIGLSSCSSEGNDDIYEGVDKTRITKPSSVDKTRITKPSSVDKTRITKPGGSNKYLELIE